tara:strand:- start:424 stop:687 length:264 start_codon:yes stop_codon:yes gene_type:complete
LSDYVASIEEKEREFQIGDLVLIVSLFTGEPVEDAPPGVVVERCWGPVLGMPREDGSHHYRFVYVLYWKGGLEPGVSPEWIRLISPA